MKKFTLILCALFLYSAAKSQVVDSMMRIYASSFPQQKIHLHLDKSVYRAGETIWFKAYLFEGFSPAIVSVNFYAELIDATGKVMERKVYPITESTAAGSFDIPSALPATVLTIRAYTTWMLNFDTAYIFQKPLTILTEEGNYASAKKEVSDQKTTLTFFPEGGELVAGLESTVAFKANNNEGLPVKVNGKITDSKGSSIATFTSQHNGMGSFKFIPTAGETYTANWNDSIQKDQTTTLPATRNEGVVLSVKLSGDKLIYNIARSDNAPLEMKSLYLVAHLAQLPIYKTKLPLENSVVLGGMIPLKNVPSGVLQVTIFNSNWEPVAERIVLGNNGVHDFEATISAPIINKAKRGRNVVEIEVDDSLLTNMSVSITDALIGRLPFEDDIISRMLLTGDIKGYVHEPGYYFSNPSDSVAAHLDLVMLTHGWRKYNWRDVAKAKMPRLKYQPDSSLALQAKVFGLASGVRLHEDEQLLAIIEKKDTTNTVVMLPRSGPTSFSLPVLFYDTVKVFYQIQKDRKLESFASILLTNNFYKGKQQVSFLNRPYVVPPSVVAIDRTKLLASELAKYKSDFNTRGNILETVTVRTKIKTRMEEMDTKYSSGLFKGTDGMAFDMMEGNNNFALNIFAFLQGRVPGIMINDPMVNPSVTWRGSATSLFLDQNPVDAQTLSTVSVNDIAYIKVFRPPFLAGIGGGAGGGIAVYTKKGNDAPKQTGAGLSKSTVVGYSVLKEFYSPNYARSIDAPEVTADYRSTLYWEPYIFTDENNKKVKIEFYNNDISKAFRIILEGVNEIGKLVRIEKIVQ